MILVGSVQFLIKISFFINHVVLIAKTKTLGIMSDSIFFGCLICSQMLYALLKKTLPCSIPYIILDPTLSLTKSDIGSIYTVFGVAYGLSKLIGGEIVSNKLHTFIHVISLLLHFLGIMSDFVSPELLYIFGIFAGSVINVIFAALPFDMVPNTRFTQVVGALWTLNGIV